MPRQSNAHLASIKGGGTQPVIQIFRGAAFDPETVTKLCAAYDLATYSLHDRGRPAIVNEVLARRIIDLAEKGERDPRALAAAALQSVGLELD